MKYISLVTNAFIHSFCHDLYINVHIYIHIVLSIYSILVIKPLLSLLLPLHYLLVVDTVSLTDPVKSLP